LPVSLVSHFSSFSPSWNVSQELGIVSLALHILLIISIMLQDVSQLHHFTDEGAEVRKGVAEVLTTSAMPST
jgi:hypothetical protein